MKVLGGALILEKGLAEKDFEECAKEGVRIVGEIGLGSVKSPEDAAPMVKWAKKYGMVVMMHTGGTSIPGSTTVGLDQVLKSDPDVVCHINGGPTACSIDEAEKLITQTSMAIEFVHCGNMKAAAEVGSLVAKHKAFHRVIIGNDAPSGTGVVPLGVLRVMSLLAGMTPIRPEQAICMATGNTAKRYKLNRGVIVEGKEADLVVMDNLESFSAERVYKDGRLVALDGKSVPFPQTKEEDFPLWPLKTPSLSPESFRIRKQTARARVIEVIPGQILTRARTEDVLSTNGWVLSDIQRDILKLVVVERHKGTGRIGRGLVHGFGLQRGALASSVAHDSHNVIAVGVEDFDLFCAVEEIRRMGGGLAVAEGGRIMARVALEIGGLMSKEPLESLSAQLKALSSAANSLGCLLPEPFMALSFLGLPVIPELKLTDRGLVDVRVFAEVPLFV